MKIEPKNEREKNMLSCPSCGGNALEIQPNMESTKIHWKCICGDVGEGQYDHVHDAIKLEASLTQTKTPVKMENFIGQIEDLVKIQNSHGNWNYDPYMHGLANGLIMCLSMAKGEEPKYLKAPGEWLKDRADEGRRPTTGIPGRDE